MHQTTTVKLRTVWQSFQDEDGTIRKIDLLCYMKEGDEFLIFSCQQGIPDGNEDTYSTTDLELAIEQSIAHLTSIWGTPIETKNEHIAI